MATQAEIVPSEQELELLFGKVSDRQSSQKTIRRRLLGWGLLGLVSVGSVFRAIALFQHSPLEVLVTDPGRWWESATHLSSIQPIAAIDPFGYPLWLGLFISIAGSSATAVACHNAALSVVTPWIWHRFIRELTGDGELALAGWAILVWLPSWIAIFSYTMSETLFLPLLGAALWSTVGAYKSRSTSSYSLSALLWALCSATRVFALPCALFVLVWINRERTNRVRKLLCASASIAIVVVPLSIRTHYILNVWHPFGFPKMNQIYMESGKRTLRFDISRNSASYRWSYEFGSPALYEEPFQPLSHWKSARTGIVYFAINEDQGSMHWDWALDFYRPPLEKRLEEWAENYVMFNFAPSWPDNNPNRFWDRASRLMRWCWLPLALLVITGNVRFRKRWGTGTKAMVMVLTTIAWTLTPLLPAVMEGRYRKPIEGLLIVNFLLLLHLRQQVTGRKQHTGLLRAAATSYEALVGEPRHPESRPLDCGEKVTAGHVLSGQTR